MDKQTTHAHFSCRCQVASAYRGMLLPRRTFFNTYNHLFIGHLTTAWQGIKQEKLRDTRYRAAVQPEASQTEGGAASVSSSKCCEASVARGCSLWGKREKKRVRSERKNTA